MPSKKEHILRLFRDNPFSDEVDIVDHIHTEINKLLKTKTTQREIIQILMENDQWRYQRPCLPRLFYESSYLMKHIVKAQSLRREKNPLYYKEIATGPVELEIDNLYRSFNFSHENISCGEYDFDKIMYHHSMDSKYLSKELSKDKPHHVRDWFPYVQMKHLQVFPKVKPFLEMIKICDFLDSTQRKEIKQYSVKFSSGRDLQSACSGIAYERIDLIKKKIKGGLKEGDDIKKQDLLDRQTEHIERLEKNRKSDSRKYGVLAFIILAILLIPCILLFNYISDGGDKNKKNKHAQQVQKDYDRIMDNIKSK